MITIYGRATSSNVQLVMWMLDELNIEHERLDYGHKFGGTDTPEYLAMNPMGRVPVLRQTRGGGEDLIMFESGAIARYLAGRYGAEPFWPSDPTRRAELDVWAEWMKVSFAPAFAQPIFWALLNHKRGAGREAVQDAAEALKPLARILNDRLGDRVWLAGDDFTFADIFIGHLLYRYNVLNFDKAPTPSLDAYYARLVDRPAFARHVMVDFEVLRLV